MCVRVFSRVCVFTCVFMCLWADGQLTQTTVEKPAEPEAMDSSEPSPSFKSTSDSPATAVKRAEHRGIDGAEGCEEMPKEETPAAAEYAVEQGIDTVGYFPREALHAALSEWLIDFHRPCSVNLSPVMTGAAEHSDGGGDGRLPFQSDSLACHPAPQTHSDVTLSESTIADRPSEAACQSLVSEAAVSSPRRIAAQFSLSHLELLADLFYLPNEYGPQGLALMDQFKWLRFHYRDYVAYLNSTEGDTGIQQASFSAAGAGGNGEAPMKTESPDKTDAPQGGDDKEVRRPDSACSDEFAVDVDMLPPAERVGDVPVIACTHQSLQFIINF